MATASFPRFQVLVVLLTFGRGSHALCSDVVMDSIFSDCITWGVKLKFISAFGLSRECNRQKISPEICQSLDDILSCIKGKNLNTVTCLPFLLQQMKTRLKAPCTTEDLGAVCPNVHIPKSWTLPTNGGNGGTHAPESKLPTNGGNGGTHAPESKLPTNGGNGGTHAPESKLPTNGGNGGTHGATSLLWMTSLLAWMMMGAYD